MRTLNQDILLVEDDSRDVELTLQEFETHHFKNRIVVLRDGAEAIKFLLEQPNSVGTDNLPGAILMGWKLPKLDGLDVLERLKSTERTRRIPTFLLLSSQHDVGHFSQHPVQPDGYLIKPVGFHDFARQFGLAEAGKAGYQQIPRVADEA